ncbi:MAG: hypothetical protein JXJ17_06310 [Anaerolineae bacterium]|nr:hypothetical protein [Anaerolineae bacterium]
MKKVIYGLLIVALLLSGCAVLLGSKDTSTEVPVPSLPPMEEEAVQPDTEETQPETAEGEEPSGGGGAAEITETQVIGWMGSVSTTPDGAEYDDFVTLVYEGVGPFGIAGDDAEVEAQIVALRDHDEPGKYAHFWGSLACGVPDVNGCQMRVDKLRVDGPGDFFDPDIVDGWEGTIVGKGDMAQVDDAFVLAGDYPIEYGISSAPAMPDGDLVLDEIIAGLRDTGSKVSVWGEMTCGVPDAGGCQIQVTKLKANGEVHEIEPYEGMETGHTCGPENPQLPVADIEGMTQEDVAAWLMSAYLDHYLCPEIDDLSRLVDYQIEGTELQSRGDLQFTVMVTFSVQPVMGIDSNWIAGNGELDDPWIRDKMLFVTVELQDDVYVIGSMGTGP